ncbi:Elongator complex protein 1 [Guyanagaster necrorhizus]|uniref:Elongator complex protein 1 n=1 Tax=Guyanagaster necrorhizus TaxID=856835 RepID=A0A9P7W0N6_9AGAR|nr:Elongator complex protein 1 [Guyanagaster necrorhizus MCA 3950]KAG7449880.1 Elongator complex protein 1 [Guyanagaster necrorhizus MCA 3950]
MRNLSLVASTSCTLTLESASISCTTIDLDRNITYIATERCNADADVEVTIWKTISDEKATCFYKLNTTALSDYTSQLQVVSFRVLLDSQQLVVVLRSGDIATVPIEDNESQIDDVVGTVDGGIFAASWSPDDSSLVLVTGDNKLILMTSTFDVLSETSLHPADFGEDAPINVGWGSKQTQFHGSAGKGAAQAPSNVNIGISPDDDTLPRISWRGDGAFFSVSSLSADQTKRRVLRVYDRQAALQTTSEPVAGLEHTLSWRPSGNLIAATQRFGFEGGGIGKAGRHDVVFFERNGLRHGEFGIRVGDPSVNDTSKSEDLMWGYKVRELRWSSDSNILALWITRKEGDIVQLWTVGNYHWYLKQDIVAPSNASRPGCFTSVEWHPESALTLILTTKSQVIRRTYAWITSSSPTVPPLDTGSVAVIDGSNVLLTPFRTQNVPPPMSSCQLAVLPELSQVPRIPIHTGFAHGSDTLAVLWETGYVEVWDLSTRLTPGRGKIMDPKRVACRTSPSAEPGSYRQIVLRSDGVLLLLGSDNGDGSDIITTIEIEGGAEQSMLMPSRNGRLLPVDQGVIWQSSGGQLFNVRADSSSFICSFPSFCLVSERIVVDDSEGGFLYLGLTESGKMYISGKDNSSALIASNATSFTLASGFLIFTTGNHEAVFADIKSLFLYIKAENENDREALKGTWKKRRVERGSRIVVPVPSAMGLVLQMPRGNLETINPRPLVMEVIKQDLNNQKYRKAFMACRKHRIDLSVIVQHDQKKFLDNVATFVEDVKEVDHINLFLTNIGRSSQPPEAIARICDIVRDELEKRNLTGYVNSILTAHVVKTPPDHESGLGLLLRLRDANPELVEDAVKYIIFLVDADKLFDTALGMYDFSLVLMIAQHSQKDPREYLPFLRELRALGRYMQKFRIDDHLKRYESALRNLGLAGDDHFDEAVAYIELHQLYETALSIWKGTERHNTVLSVYGDWLFERREFRQAASVFVESGALSKALVAYEKVLEWQCLFDLAVRTEMPEEDLVAMGYRVGEDLTSKKRYLEAARVILDYAKDTRETVITLVQGNEFAEARRIMTLHHRPDLLADVIYPGALESRYQIKEDVNEMREQLRKQFSRLQELRIKKVEAPDAFFGVEDTALHNVDVMTDVSMPYTAFTRYTAAPSATSRSSKQSSRSKRKQERKVGSGRKGTVDEEEYLFKSVAKLVVKFTSTRDEARSLIPHLFEFTPDHREEGSNLQKEIDAFERELQETVEDIWKKPAEGGESATDSWATRMEQVEKAKWLNPVDSVPKPELGRNADWRLRLLDLDLGA